MMVPRLEPAVRVNWIRIISHNRISDVQLDFNWYRSVSEDDGCFPSDFVAVVRDDRVDVFSQGKLCETGGRFFGG